MHNTLDIRIFIHWDAYGHTLLDPYPHMYKRTYAQTPLVFLNVHTHNDTYPLITGSLGIRIWIHWDAYGHTLGAPWTHLSRPIPAHVQTDTCTNIPGIPQCTDPYPLIYGSLGIRILTHWDTP